MLVSSFTHGRSAMRWKPLLNVVLTILVLGGAGLAVWKAYEASRPETRAEQVARLQREITAQRALEDQARAEARAQPETPANLRAAAAAPPPAAGAPTRGTFYSPSRQP